MSIRASAKFYEKLDERLNVEFFSCENDKLSTSISDRKFPLEESSCTFFSDSEDHRKVGEASLEYPSAEARLSKETLHIDMAHELQSQLSTIVQLYR